jgi:hypothetical protein
VSLAAIRFAEDEIEAADICRNKSLDTCFFDEPTEIV